MKMQYPNTTSNATSKAEQRYLEGFLKSSEEKPVYILAILRSNVTESTIKDLEDAYETNYDVIGVTGLIDTVAVVAKGKDNLYEIAESLKIMTGKHVGILEYHEEDLTKIYSDVFKAAELAEREMRNGRIYEPKKDSLEGKLGMTRH